VAVGLAAPFALGVAQSGAARPDTAKRLVGTWSLVSLEARSTGGETRYPFGRTARGQLVYDAAGHMSAHVMNPDRAPFASADPSQVTDAELRAAVMGGYLGYCGTYTLDLTRGVVTHHVQGAIVPNWVGGDQVRYFRLDGDRLTITTPPQRVGGEDLTTVLVWERARR